MRNAFASEITALAEQDERLVLLSGDIGNRLFDEFKKRFPERFFNCGVAEGNMIGMAAGMAHCGLRPVTYTIASFSTTRCFEQIRVDACCQNLPVLIVGVGAGLAYAANGGTHHSCEDIAILRALPNMTVICPGDPTEVRLAFRAAFDHTGPVYLRLGKKGEPVVHPDSPDFKIGKGIIVRPGRDICLLSTGNMLSVAMQAAETLDDVGASAQVVSLHTIKPLDEPLLAEAFADFEVVVTLEEHSLLGGLGGAVAEWLADQPRQKARLFRVGTADTFLHEAGGQQYAREFFGLTPDKIAGRILSLMNNDGEIVK
jgi:transketolase